jgi:DnaJ-class molecular chaperone
MSERYKCSQCQGTGKRVDLKLCPHCRGKGTTGDVFDYLVEEDRHQRESQRTPFMEPYRSDPHD